MKDDEPRSPAEYEKRRGAGPGWFGDESPLPPGGIHPESWKVARPPPSGWQAV